jgi:hypothetical protein
MRTEKRGEMQALSLEYELGSERILD